MERRRGEVADLLLSVECKLGHSSLMAAAHFSLTLRTFIAHLLSQGCHLGPLLFLHQTLPLAHSGGMIQPSLCTAVVVSRDSIADVCPRAYPIKLVMSFNKFSFCTHVLFL